MEHPLVGAEDLVVDVLAGDACLHQCGAYALHEGQRAAEVNVSVGGHVQLGNVDTAGEVAALTLDERDEACVGQLVDELGELFAQGQVSRLRSA